MTPNAHEHDQLLQELLSVLTDDGLEVSGEADAFHLWRCGARGARGDVCIYKLSQRKINMDGIWMEYGWNMDGIWMEYGWNMDGTWMV